MKYVIDKDKRPVYLQLYEQLKADIVAGVYPFGSKLPSKRSLSEESGVSVITVEHAYALLIDEGYVEGRERSGYVVVFRKADGFLSSSTGDVRFAIKHRDRGEYPDFPISVLSKTMRSVLTEAGEMILERSPSFGLMEVREAISRYLLRNRGIKAEAEQIIIGSGSEYLYGLVPSLLGRGRVYGIESPSYNKIEEVYRAENIKYESLPLTDTGIDTSALLKTEASVLHTTPYRSYPTGVSATASKRHEYLLWASMGDRFIIEDDFESEFSVNTKPTETLFALSEGENVIYLNTFSKTVSPSLRIAYMVLPRKLLPAFREKLGFYSCTVSTFMQCVVAKLINNGDFERHINRVRRKIRSKK